MICVMMGAMGLGGIGSGQGRAVFYRFTDASGRVHIVDSLDLVPTPERAHAERIQYDARDEQTPVNGLLPEHTPLSTHGPIAWPTLALGVGGAIVLWLVFRRLPGTLRVVLRLAIVASVIALLGGAYLGWTRRIAHQSNDLIASPGALIDDAKSAVDKMNARMKAQQAEIKEAEQSK